MSLGDHGVLVVPEGVLELLRYAEETGNWLADDRLGALDPLAVESRSGHPQVGTKPPRCHSHEVDGLGIGPQASTGVVGQYGLEVRVDG